MHPIARKVSGHSIFWAATQITEEKDNVLSILYTGTIPDTRIDLM